MKSVILGSICTVLIGMSLLSASTAATAAPTPANGGPKTYYLDCLAGSDQASGTTVVAPWKSLEKISSTVFSPGDAIRIKKGTACVGTLAPQGSGTADAPITVDAYGVGPAPQIQGAGAPRAIKLYNQQGWEIRNLDVSNKGVAIGNRRAVSVELKDFGTASHFVLENLTIHDVNGDDTKDTGGSGGIYFSITGNSTQTKFDGISVKNNTIRSVDREGIFMVSTWNRSGFEAQSAGLFLPWPNVVISGNQLSDLGGDGIVPGNTTGALVERNKVDGFQKRSAGYNAGMWTYDSDNTIFQYNEATGGKTTRDGMAYDVDQGTDGVIFQYNYSHDNAGGFMLLCNSNGVLRNAVVRYNISINDSYRGVENCSGPIESAAVYNNTILIGPGISQSVIQENNTTKRNVSFRNNIVVKRGPGTASINLAGGGYQVQNNDFVGVSKAPAGFGISKEPKFLSEAAGPEGLRLCLGSPAIGTGAAITNDGGKDYFGNPIPNSAKPNIGAYAGVGVSCLGNG